VEAAQAARAAPPAREPPSGPDLLLDGLARVITEGHEAGTPLLKRALRMFRDDEVPAHEQLRWQWIVSLTATDLWDDATWRTLAERYVAVARATGALATLPTALSSLAGTRLFAGELMEAARIADELEAAIEAMGGHPAPYIPLGLAALEGRDGDVEDLVEITMTELVPRGEGIALGLIQWARAFMHNGAGRYDAALEAAEQTPQYPAALLYARWALIEHVEAAARSGQPERGAAALRKLRESTTASGTDWALGVEARSRALLSDDADAEPLYQEAIERLSRTSVRLELARAHLVYGEWLRRARRRLDARDQLRTARELFTALGIGAFSQRAARELLATGETARSPTERSRRLTPQEGEIARLARDGLSNPEIAGRLFISRRTVEYHLRKIYMKLDISSRGELHRVLDGDGPPMR
jgi:DNA-binding CsgD family transcriptional regulator